MCLTTIITDLNHVIDPKHLGRIADAMYEWEGRIAEELGLDQADVRTIKTRHQNEHKLQMYVDYHKFLVCACPECILHR